MEFAVRSSYYFLPGKCACQSERSLPYFHLDRSSDLFAIHDSSSHTLLAPEERFRELSSYSVLTTATFQTPLFVCFIC